MNKTITIGLIIVIVLLIALLVSRNDTMVSTTTNQDGRLVMDQTPITPSIRQTGSASIESLRAQGKTMTCTFTYTDPKTGTGSGIGFFDGPRMRVDGTLTKDGKPFEMHMLSNGTQMYTWTTSAEGNFAFTMPHSRMTDSQIQGSESISEDVTYTCTDWNVDESTFVQPSNIEFIDMANVMNGMGAQMKDLDLDAMMEVNQ